MKRSGAWAVGMGLVAGLAACQGKPAVTVAITSPTDGATVTGPAVDVTLTATGIELAPASEERAGTAHHHLFLDVDATPPGDTIPAGVTGIIHLGRAQTEFHWDSVPPGPHRIIAVLADAWHVPLRPLVADTVNLVVTRN
ncbi:MAG: DUF4399 domain-containing protein [Gemmatimonadetes bacterium]|nr:DUF4399 domain-containing protein [Gemmatimonadota bacterium]